MSNGNCLTNKRSNNRILIKRGAEEAVGDALVKAEHLAALTGVTPDKPVSISEGGGYVPVPGM